MGTLNIPLLVLSCAGPMMGQVFPYDRACDTIFAGDRVTILALEDHTRLFGKDTVTLEIYYEPTETTKRDDGWDLTTRCTETLFVHKKKLSGNTLWACNGTGRYTFLFYREGCYLLQEMEFLPGRPSSTRFEVFGRCPPKKTKSM